MISDDLGKGHARLLEALERKRMRQLIYDVLGGRFLEGIPATPVEIWCRMRLGSARRMA